MFKTAVKKTFQYSISTASIVLLLSSLLITVIVAATSVDTTFNHTIGQGALGVAIVDGAGDPVVSPSVSFAGGVTFSFTPQDTTATLGTASEKIRLTNATTTATWSMSIAAKLGPGTTWTTGTYTHPFDSTGGADSGRLTVNPSGGTITPMSGCNTTGLTLGSSNYFVNGTTDSITLLSAGGTAGTLCYWDLTGVALTQRLPAEQEPGAYSLSMTVSVL